MRDEIHAGQSATLLWDARNAFVKAHFIRVNRTQTGGTRTIDLPFDGALPAGAGADSPVQATTVGSTARPALKRTCQSLFSRLTLIAQEQTGSA